SDWKYSARVTYAFGAGCPMSSLSVLTLARCFAFTADPTSRSRTPASVARSSLRRSGCGGKQLFAVPTIDSQGESAGVPRRSIAVSTLMRAMAANLGSPCYRSLRRRGLLADNDEADQGRDGRDRVFQNGEPGARRSRPCISERQTRSET